MASESTLNILSEFAPLFNFVQEGKAKNKNPLDLCIQDFIPEKIVDVEAHLRSWVKQDVKKDYQRKFESKKARFDEHFQLSLQEVMLHTIDLRTNEIFEHKVSFFRSGKCLRSFYKEMPPTEFHIPLLLKKGESLKDFLQSNAESFKKGELKNTFLRLNHQRKREGLSKNLSIQELCADLDLIERASAQHLLIKFYLKVCHKAAKPLDELNQKDILTFKQELDSLITDFNKQREKKAEAAAEALIAEESIKKNTKKKKPLPKSKPISQISLKSSSFTKQISLINSSEIKSLFILHPRVTRWDATLDKVKRFMDYDQNTRHIVRRYQQCSFQELTYMKQCHYLPGIEKFLSIEEFHSKYSFSYHYQPKNSQEKKEGRGIFAKMITTKSQETGIIYIGVGKDNVLFHAMFHVMKESHFLPETLVKSLEGEDIKNEENDSSDSTHTHSTQFSMLEGDVVEMRIESKDNESVLFHLYPL